MGASTTARETCRGDGVVKIYLGRGGAPEGLRCWTSRLGLGCGGMLFGQTRKIKNIWGSSDLFGWAGLASEKMEMRVQRACSCKWIQKLRFFEIFFIDSRPPHAWSWPWVMIRILAGYSLWHFFGHQPPEEQDDGSGVTPQLVDTGILDRRGKEREPRE